MDMYFSTLLISLLSAVAVNAHSTGAPAEVCGSMMPGHGVPPQETPFPYDIIVEKPELHAGESTKVTIKGKNGEVLKGYLIQARVGGEPVGKFSTDNYGKVMDCGNGKENAVTHVNASDKKEVTVTWTAPQDLKGKVIFYVTIVKVFDTFWVQQKSVPVTIS